MDKKGFSEKAGIFLSCKIEKYASKEMVMSEHALVRLVSGASKIVQADKVYTFGPGDTILVPRNQLGRVTKYPADGQPYKAILIYFTQDFLQKYYAAHTPQSRPATNTNDKSIRYPSPGGKLICFPTSLFYFFGCPAG
jgi:hypothetical protein